MPAKALALFIYLLLDTAGLATRERVAARLFEKSSQQQANSSLRQLLRRVKSFQAARGVSLIEHDAQTVRLSNDLPSCDLCDLLSMGALKTASDLESVLDLYRDELLAGCSFDEEDLDLWLMQRRQTIADHVSGLLSDPQSELGPHMTRQVIARVTSLFPYDDGLHATLIRQLARAGRLFEASRLYIALRQRLIADIKNAEAPLSDAAFAELRKTPALVRGVEPLPLAADPDIGSASRSMPRLALIGPRAYPSDALGHHTEALVSGLVEEVSAALTRVKAFGVIAPFSARQFAQTDPFEMLASYKVDYGVQTRLVKAAPDGLLLSSSLVRTATREVLWSETFPLDLEGSHLQYLGFVQLLSALIAENVQRAEIAAIHSSRDVDAYQYCLLGQHHLSQSIDLPAVRRARKCFRSAIQMDRTYASPHSSLAQTFVLEWMMVAGNDTSLLDLANMSAGRAIELDSSDGNGHRQLGRVALFKGRFDESLELLDVATTIMPNHADLLADFADTLMHNSDVAQAKRRIDHALLLNPLAPDVYRWIAGGIEFFSHNYEGALDHLRIIKNKDQVLRLMSACAAMMGDTGRAAEYRLLSLEVDPYFELAKWLARLPVRNREHLLFYADALRAAGYR